MESLAVPGTLDSLDSISEYVQSAAAAAGLDEPSSYRLRLAVDEIATNIITHGYQEAGCQGTLWLSADVDSEKLIIYVEDTAVAYDPMKAPFPNDLDRPPRDRQPGGLGLFLARRGADELSYERVENRNRNIIVMARPVGE